MSTQAELKPAVSVFCKDGPFRSGLFGREFVEGTQGITVSSRVVQLDDGTWLDGPGGMVFVPFWNILYVIVGESK